MDPLDLLALPGAGIPTLPLCVLHGNHFSPHLRRQLGVHPVGMYLKKAGFRVLHHHGVHEKPEGCPGILHLTPSHRPTLYSFDETVSMSLSMLETILEKMGVNLPTSLC